MNQNQIPQIEPMPLSELQEAVIAAKDDMQRWERICSDFRLMRSKGRIYAIIPTSAVSVDEARLFTNPRISRYAIALDALEGDNLNMFFMAAMRSRQSAVMLEDVAER